MNNGVAHQCSINATSYGHGRTSKEYYKDGLDNIATRKSTVIAHIEYSCSGNIGEIITTT